VSKLRIIQSVVSSRVFRIISGHGFSQGFSRARFCLIFFAPLRAFSR
jgi:hypothetical protein